jgi:hypothetical protein
MSHRGGSGDDAPPTFGDFGDGCRGKVRHTSRGHAKGALRVLLRRSPDPRGWPMSEYKCRECHKWHTGHTPRRRRES